VKAKDCKNVLANMGVTVTEKEEAKLLKTLPVSRKKIHASKLPVLMENLENELEKDDYKDLISYLPMDENEMVDLNAVMEEAKTFTGEKVDTDHLSHELRKMGLVLTDEEHKELLASLSAYSGGKIYKKRLLKRVKNLKGPQVKIKKVESLLESMGVRMKDEEYEELMAQLSANGDRTVGLNDLMDAVSYIK
uniref:EF-hand domain-containing protein n=1 Tax=Jaculus jaculus TaxID=51337 RepID=A0A8C5KMK4_JACJA